MAITPADIRLIYPNGKNLDDPTLQAMIDMVQGLTAELLADCGYSTTMQESIEKYMVAHYLAVGYDQGGLVRKRTGDSEERYRELSLETNGMGMTIYGQQALALDINGCLTTLATNVVQAQFRVI